MNFEVVPAHEISLAEQARVFNQAFADYVADWHELDVRTLAQFLCTQGADLCYSRFVCAKGGLASFGYINRTGNVSRLAGMGTVPDARRTGAAAYLLRQLLAEAKARGDKETVLEVFEQNSPALSLYRAFGFAEVSRLFGWRRAACTTPAEQQRVEISEVPILDAIKLRNIDEFPKIPWQISRHAVVKVAGGRAFGTARACVVVGDTSADAIRVHAFFASEDDAHELRPILAAVIGRFPQKQFFAAQIFPDEVGAPNFEPLRFTREALNQFLMRREL